jgi:hypothetical protein
VGASSPEGWTEADGGAVMTSAVRSSARGAGHTLPEPRTWLCTACGSAAVTARSRSNPPQGQSGRHQPQRCPADRGRGARAARGRPANGWPTGSRSRNAKRQRSTQPHLSRLGYCQGLEQICVIRQYRRQVTVATSAGPEPNRCHGRR